MIPDERFEAKQAAMSDAKLTKLGEKKIHKLARPNKRNYQMCAPPMVTDADMLYCELIKRFRKLTTK